MDDEVTIEQTQDSSGRAYEAFVDIEETVDGENDPLSSGEKAIGRVVGVEQRPIRNAPKDWLAHVAEEWSQGRNERYATPEEFAEWKNERETGLGRILQSLAAETEPTLITDELGDSVIIFDVIVDETPHQYVIPKDRFNENGLPPAVETYPTVDRVSNLAERNVPVVSIGDGFVNVQQLREEDIETVSASKNEVWDALQDPSTEVTRTEDGTYDIPTFQRREMHALGALICMLSLLVLSFGVLPAPLDTAVGAVITGVTGISWYLFRTGYLQISTS